MPSLSFPSVHSMAELSDFLGHILEEVTRARVQADNHSLQIARAYANDDTGLLKYFPVPRMRLPTLEITAPVIVSNVPAGNMLKADPERLSRAIASDLEVLLANHKITIATDDIVRIIRADPELSMGFLNANAAEALSAKVAVAVMAGASDAAPPVRKTPTAPDKRAPEGDERHPAEADDSTDNSREVTRFAHESVVNLIREQISKTIGALPTTVRGIAVDATTANVKTYSPASGQAASVMYIKMTITEEALEMELEPVEPSEATEPAQPTVIRRLSPE